MANYIDALAAMIIAALIVDLNILCTEGCLEDQYIGCYQDMSTASSRSNWTTGVTDSNTMSIELCMATCQQYRKTYAILQNGRSCLCGDVLNFNLSDASCDKRCSGNDRQVCGGSSGSASSNVIYSVCPVGFYGDACSEICHCKARIPCNFLNGICETGCEDSWTLNTCSKATAQYLADKSIGCYLDKVNRTMEYEHGYFFEMPNVVEKCSSICASKNYPYTGLEVRHECFCGGSYTKYGPLNDSRCGQKCNGETDQRCGGDWALSVYFACPNGYFGPGCMSRCNYAVERRCVCDNSSCSSECKSGWMGHWCEIRNCSDNNGDCAVNETCVTVDLMYSTINRCNCKAGYQKNHLWDTCRPTGFPTSPSLEPQRDVTISNEQGHNIEQVYSLGTVIGAAIGSAIGSAVIFASILIVVLLCRRRRKQNKNSNDVNGINQKDDTDAAYERPMPTLDYETLKSKDSSYAELNHYETQLQ